MKARLTILLGGALVLAAPVCHCAAARFTNAPVRAVITVADRENTVVLAGRTDADLFYSPPNVPEGVYASIPLAGVQNARLEFTVDETALNAAVTARRWREAAVLLLKALEPTLPYVDLPGNEAADAVAIASGYLINAATLARQGGAEGAKAAEPLLATVVRLSDRLQGAAWFYGAEAARLRAALGRARSTTSFMSRISTSQTLAGSFMNASMCAYSMGSIFSHRPPFPRKGGIPLSTEIPAPVNATARSAAARSRAALLIWESIICLRPVVDV